MDASVSSARRAPIGRSVRASTEVTTASGASRGGRQSRRERQSIAASATVTIDTTRLAIQPATLAAITIAPRAVPMPTMPAVATTRAKTDSKVRRSGCSGRNPPPTGASPVRGSSEPVSTFRPYPPFESGGGLVAFDSTAGVVRREDRRQRLAPSGLAVQHANTSRRRGDPVGSRREDHRLCKSWCSKRHHGDEGLVIQAKSMFHDEKGGARWVHSPIR